MIEPDPTRTRPITMAIYPHRSADEQPVIHCYVPRKRRTSQLSGLIEQLQGLSEQSTLSEAERIMNAIIDAVRPLVAGWNGLEDERGALVEFDPDRLEDVLTDDDIGQLAGEILNLGMLGTREKKASASPSPSTGQTATPTTPATSTAPNAPAPDASPAANPTPKDAATDRSTSAAASSPPG